jgi:hypothetical protein
MKWIRTVMREIYGLFVDDLRFTVSILAWLGVAWLGVAWFGAAEAARMQPGRLPWLPAVLLFTGLGGILMESALRFARRR